MAHETLKQQLDRLMAPNFGTHAIWESNPGVPGSLAAARDAEKSRIDDFIKPAEVMNDSLLTYDNEIQTFTDSGVIIPVSDSVVSIDKTATIGLVTVPNLEGIESGTATDVAIKSMDDISAQLQADLAVQVEEENLYATATPLAQESLSDKARKDSTRLKEKENKEESIAAHAKYQNDRIENIANKSDNAAELNAERVIIDKTATIGLVTVPNDEGIESGIATDVAIKSMDDISSKLQADLKVQV